MVVLREMRRQARFLIGPVLGLAATVYFTYNLVEGDHGLWAWLRLNHELRIARDGLTAITAQRQALEQRVADMRPDHVDPDLLDEEVRRTLDLAAPDEIVIPEKPAPAK